MPLNPPLSGRMGDYFEPILTQYNPDNVFDALDFIHDNKDKIIHRINKSLSKSRRDSGSTKIRAFIDFDKVVEYRKSLSYCQIVKEALNKCRYIFSKSHEPHKHWEICMITVKMEPLWLHFYLVTNIRLSGYNMERREDGCR